MEVVIKSQLELIKPHLENITTSCEKTYVAKSLREADEKITKIGLIIAAIYLAVILPFVEATLHPDLVSFILSVHVVLLLAIAGLGIYHFKTKRPLAPWGLALSATGALLMAYVNYNNLTLSQDVEIHWMSLMATLFVNGWILLNIPTRYRGWQFFIPFYIAIAITSCIIGGVSAQALCAVAVFLICFSMMKLTFHRMLQNEGARNFQLQNAARQLERGQIEHELHLARKIQMSLLPPKELVLSGGMELKFFSKPHEQVGGDWAAVRTLKSGETIILIADACGKGIQAALVLHAIQSLWANALANEFFDPRTWLESVNGALISLGKGEPHLATLGILNIGFDFIQYWSAGHPPCYLIHGVGASREVKAIIARGNVVGVNKDLDLNPVICPYQRQVDSIVMGSDGFFKSRHRITRETIISSAELLHQNGEYVLAEESCDDQTVILLSPCIPMEKIA